MKNISNFLRSLLVTLTVVMFMGVTVSSCGSGSQKSSDSTENAEGEHPAGDESEHPTEHGSEHPTEGDSSEHPTD